MGAKQITLAAIALLVTGLAAYFLRDAAVLPSSLPHVETPAPPVENTDLSKKRLLLRSLQLETYARKNGYSTQTALLLDMSLPSGRKRFFVYDLDKDSILHAGLVAHGSCNGSLLEEAAYSNTVSSGCSSPGKYKIGYAYQGNFGKAYKLHGLDSSNSNAFERYIVLHAYGCVPDTETFPEPICNSLGCPMVSHNFLDTLSTYIDRSDKPVLLWIYPPDDL